MLTRKNIEKAVIAMLGHVDLSKLDPVTQQIASSLKVYDDRGEWDRTMQGAIDCLEIACYEIDAKRKRQYECF